MNEFVNYLAEVFELFGAVSIRKMFGGYGVYRDGLMFALVANDTLYLKADAENVRYFDELGLGKFEYQKQGKVMSIAYYQAPADILEDCELAATWAKRSFDAALRAQSKKRKTKRAAV